MPNVRFTFADALSELLPRLMPEIFLRKDSKGTLVFAIEGHDVTSYDYLKKLSRREAPLTAKINITNFATYGAEPCYIIQCNDVAFDIDRYLAARGDATIRTWADWVAHARFREDLSRAGAENWVNLKNHAAAGKADRLARSYIGRLALQRVMAGNSIAAFVHAENTVPTPKIQGPNVGEISLDGITPVLPDPEDRRPRGHERHHLRAAVRVERHEDRLRPESAAEHSGHEDAPPDADCAHSLRGPGRGAALIRIGTAYESATHHRTPPGAFGPIH